MTTKSLEVGLRNLCLAAALGFGYNGPASAVSCEAVFSNAVGTTGGELKLEEDARLSNTGDRVLATDDLDQDGGHCDGSSCIESGTPAPSLDMPANSSNSDYNSSPLSFSAGDYYYKDFELGDDKTLTITSGPVRIHVRDDLQIKENARVNYGGDSNLLIFFVEDDVTIEEDARVNAIIFSEGDVQIEEDARITGAVTGDNIELKEDARVTFNPVTTADFAGACEGSTSATLIAELRIDELVIDGSAGELNDTQGNFNTAAALGTDEGVALVDAKLCNGLSIPANTTEADRWGVASGIDVDADIGSRGSIGFWYKSNAAWNGGADRTLVDGSHDGTSEYFYLVLSSSGKLRFRLEDSADDPVAVETGTLSHAAGAWKHITITWDLPARSTKIYVDGVELAEGNDANSGTIGDLDSLYFGDNRGSYHFQGSNNSADGVIDEIRIYDGAIDAAQIASDMTETRSCPGGTPIAEFRLDELSVDGSVGELVDTQGSFTTARALGTGSGVTSVDAKVCRGITIPANTSQSSKWGIDTGVDVNADIGSRGTVGFWYKSNTDWNGGGNRMLLDASEDSGDGPKYFFLELQSGGRLQFDLEDSSDGDLRLTTPVQSFAAGTWQHIAVTWDLSSGTRTVYVNGSPVQTESDGTTGQIGTLETLYIGDNRGDYHPEGSNNSADGVIDEVRIYNTAVDAVTIARDMAISRDCAAAAVDADGFNCVASGADALSGGLYLKLAGTAFGFDVAALKDSDGNGSMDAVETGFASEGDRDLVVELVDTSTGAACAARPALSPAVGQTLTFTATDAGRKAAAAMTVAKAYRSVGCRVTDTNADPVLVACSTDSFAIRPTALTLATPALDNAGATGEPKQSAGSSFTLTVDSVAGYDGTPLIDAARLSAHAGAVRTGTLSGGFGSADPSTGTASGSGFSYSEVGNFRFVAEGLYDASYTAVDQPGDCTDDFSNSAVGGKYGCKFGNTGDTAWIGRFTPDHFTAAVLSDGALADGCAAGGFSYQGQAIGFSADPQIRVTARNGAAEVTQNYTGGYAKLSGASFTFDPISGDAGQIGIDGSTPVALAWSAGSLGLSDNGDGTLDLTLSGDSFTWGRATNDLIAPFTTDLDLSLSAVSDGDGVAGSGLPVVVQPLGVDMRYGRLALVNAHGSELQDLAVPMQVEQYQGAATGFVANLDDSCSSVSGFVLGDLDAGDGLLPAETCIWDDADVTGLGCAGPGPGSKQYATTPLAGGFNLNLKAPGSGNTGALTISADAPSWLEFGWGGAGDTDPGARATFGIFNRSTSIIYQRELR